MSPPRTPPDVAARIVDIRKRRKLSANAIAMHVGISRDRVTTVLVQAGLHPPRPSREARGERLEAQP